ncbi:MAG TPA: hypothetical protein PKE12_09945 [Kiritimatiellia bacterium]|nr:hypothetical protein [Kiritimatiellia bacterium]
MPRSVPPRRRRIQWPWVRLALMALGGLTLLAVTADLSSMRLQADKAVAPDGESSLVADALIAVSTATNRYADFAGRFTAPHPPSWAVYPYKNPGDYDVTLRGPHRMEVAIMTRPIGAGGLAAVHAELKATESRLRIVTNIEETEFHGYPAYRRLLPLGTITVEAIDFAAGPLHVHLAASAPRSSFDDLRPVLAEMMEGVRVNDQMTNDE